MASPKVELLTGITAKTSQNWTNYVAQDKGFFAEEGLVHTHVVMGDMREGMDRLTAGTVPIVTAMADTPLLEIEKGAAIRIVGSVARTAFGHVVALPDCERIEELKGRELAVIDPRSGSTVILREILRGAGLGREDYGVRHLGGTPRRFEALKRREVAAAFLSPPYDFQAQAEGYRFLADYAEYFPAYPLAINVNLKFAKEQPETVVKYLKAMLRAAKWIYEPENRNEAISILASNTETSREFSEKTYDYVIDGIRGITPDCSISVEQLTRLTALLTEAGLCGSGLSGKMAEIFDLSYLRNALSAG